MDIRKQHKNTNEERNTPKWMHLQHPKLGHFMYHGEPEHVDETGALMPGVDEDNPNIEKVEICIYYQNSDTAIRYRDERKRQLYMQATSAAGVSRKIQADQQTETFLKNERLLYAIAIIDGFRGFVDSENEFKPLAPTDENKRLLMDWHEHVHQMVLNFAEEESNFFDFGEENTSSSQE